MIDEYKKRIYSGILIVLAVIGAAYSILGFAPYIDFVVVILTVIGLMLSLTIFMTPIKILASHKGQSKKLLSGILLALSIIGFVYCLIFYDFLKFDALLLAAYTIGLIVCLLLYFEPIGKKKVKHGKKKV
jgi:ABC-type multidrug transport system permease subunit